MKNFISKNRIWLTLIPVIAIMTVIFCMSAQTADNSLKTSGGFVNAALKIFVPNFDSLSVQEQDDLMLNVTNIVRKAAHFCEYGALGFFMMLHIDAVNMKKKIKKMWLWSTGICFVYACTDELHQMFVDGRGPGIKDVMIDTSGALTGTLVMILILYIVRKKVGHRKGA